MRRHIALAFAGALALAACSDAPRPGRGIYMLLDTSGTYSLELKHAQLIINAILSSLNPGDSFAVARIDTGSFTEKDIVARVTFDDRPSVANQQKLQFKTKIDKFVKEMKPAPHTDITGGLLQAVEYLNEKNPGRKTVLIYSDMQEDLAQGYVRNSIPLALKGFEVVALNVTKLRSDNLDPREYMQRLEKWRTRVATGGGGWRVINDLDNVETILPH
jgi:hypothetical protein